MVTPEMAGAFTGGISAPMLKSVGVEWALAGGQRLSDIQQPVGS